MEYESLTKAQKNVVHTAMGRTHFRRVELQVFRRSDGKAMFSLTNRFMGGSIQGDVDRAPVTFLECDILDDDFVLNWSHNAHRKFFVQVVDSRFVEAFDDWVSDTVFTGPLWEFERAGVLVQLVAEGPEHDAMGSIRQPDFWPAKTRSTFVVRQLLTRAGAKPRNLSIPPRKAKLPRDVTVKVRLGKDRNKKKKGFQGPVRRRLIVGRDDTYWGAAEPIVEAQDRELYGDPRGKLLMRPPVQKPTFALTERNLLSPVNERPSDTDEQVNTWIIKGANPKGPRKRIVVRVTLPKRHPESAHQRRWNDTPRQVIEIIDNRNLETEKEARRVGQRRRDRAAREGLEHDVEAVPCRFALRPNGMGSVPVNGTRRGVRVKRWTYPLGPTADALSIGTTRMRKLR